jgi:uncharacterized protein
MKKTVHIKGMHCKSCEVMLERDLKKITGVNKVTVSHTKGVAEIYSHDDVDLGEVTAVIEKNGEYKVVEEHEKTSGGSEKRGFYDYAFIAALFALVGAVVFVLKDIGISRYLPDFGDQVNVFIALVLGIVASLSTCLALVGGIVMSFGEAYPIAPDRKHPTLSRLVPHLYFHLGRVVGFALLGGLLGLIGKRLSYSVQFSGVLTIFVAVVMLYIGLQVLGLVPNITRLGFALPKGVAHKIDSFKLADHHLMPVLIGVLTFFVPCGFTQSMQLASVASGSFVGGATIMGVFALGTMPVLLGIGFGSSYAKKNRFGFLNELIAVIIIFFALYSLNSGLVLAGSSFTLSNIGQKPAQQAAVTDDKIQVIKMDVDFGFSPDSFTLKKGVPVRWEINGINVSGCVNTIVIPKLGISQRLKQGLNVIEFTPEETGTLPFSCGMGMVNGRFTVTD